MSFDAFINILPISDGSLECSLGRKGEGRPPILLTYDTWGYQTTISARNKKASKWESDEVDWEDTHRRGQFPVGAFFMQQSKHLSVSLLTGQHEGRHSTLVRNDKKNKRMRYDDIIDTRYRKPCIISSESRAVYAKWLGFIMRRAQSLTSDLSYLSYMLPALSSQPTLNWTARMPSPLASTPLAP